MHAYFRCCINIYCLLWPIVEWWCNETHLASEVSSVSFRTETHLISIFLMRSLRLNDWTVSIDGIKTANAYFKDSKRFSFTCLTRPQRYRRSCAVWLCGISHHSRPRPSFSCQRNQTPGSVYKLVYYRYVVIIYSYYIKSSCYCFAKMCKKICKYKSYYFNNIYFIQTF